MDFPHPFSSCCLYISSPISQYRFIVSVFIIFITSNCFLCISSFISSSNGSYPIYLFHSFLPPNLAPLVRQIQLQRLFLLRVSCLRNFNSTLVPLHIPLLLKEILYQLYHNYLIFTTLGIWNIEVVSYSTLSAIYRFTQYSPFRWTPDIIHSTNL